MSVTTRSPQMVLRPQTFSELTAFATMAAKSSLVPRDYVGKPENIMLAIQMGSEIGLPPMQALQNIAVINGRPSVWGDAMLALVQAHPDCEDIQERVEGDGDKMTARCIVKRAGRSPVEGAFSVEDAKRAGLFGKSGPWQQYPKRMLQMRARGFALRDAFPDALKGLISAEEARDIPQDAPPRDTFTGTTIDATAEPVAPKATEATLAQRVQAAVERINDAPATAAALTKIERATAQLVADLESANETDLLARLQTEIAGLREAAQMEAA